MVESIKLPIADCQFDQRSCSIGNWQSHLILHLLDRFVINPSSRLLSDQSNLIQHAEAVTHDTNLASFIVVPANWNLTKPETGAISQVDKFDVESKSIYCRSLDQWATRVHTKRFKSTLSVPKGKASRQTNDHVEDTTALLSTPRLMYSD